MSRDPPTRLFQMSGCAVGGSQNSRLQPLALNRQSIERDGYVAMQTCSYLYEIKQLLTQVLGRTHHLATGDAHKNFLRLKDP